MVYLKGYMKAVKAKLAETNPERVPIFEKQAAVFAKKVLTNFKDYEFYTGESMKYVLPSRIIQRARWCVQPAPCCLHASCLPSRRTCPQPRQVYNLSSADFHPDSRSPDGMVALLNYREDGTTPFL